MKNTFLCTQHNEAWALQAQQHYEQKINYFINFNIHSTKTKSLSREQKALKKEEDSKSLLKKIKPNSTVILFDERGKLCSSSLEFSKELISVWEGSPSQVYFIVGGAYGVNEKIKALSNKSLSLSRQSFNHHLAQIMALEQIYRSLSIWKNRPYHNS
ncbi:MAG: 23S rRNA (pseudouridine(1915)-N(3))-methyltransferase RlmH [Bdellovibrionaceae bacterium]|nr:23S rRNA (pseudouridine(1915)-N(3))-methyltransferase RlmH [Pseudobdellovibrionaceae bacterium]